MPCPHPDVQQRLLAVLQDNERTKALQHQPYSMVSYAWGKKYQQSNQWALEYARAGHGIKDDTDTRPSTRSRVAVQGLRAHCAQARSAHAYGRAIVGSANIAFDDHPSEKALFRPH